MAIQYSEHLTMKYVHEEMQIVPMPPPFEWDQLITNFLQQISAKKKKNNNKNVTKTLEVKKKKRKFQILI